MARDPAATLARAQQQAEIARLRLEGFKARQALAVLKRTYDAARPNQYHPKRGDKRSGDATMQHAGTRLRELARYLDENSDIAIAVLDDLTNKAIGTGIGIEPTVKSGRGGTLARGINDALRAMWRGFTDEMIDTRRELPWGELQRAVFRSFVRDGEVFTRHIEGAAAIRHRGPIPYSLELLEADYCPMDSTRTAPTLGNRVVHGVELNGWGEAVAFHFLDQHPGDFGLVRTASLMNTRAIAAAGVTHLKFARRLGQVRGVTLLHGALNRLSDIKDYDESELIAARVASAFTVAITRSEGFTGDLRIEDGRRQFELAPGLVIDDLLPGESIETIDSKRPNTAYDNFRTAQVRGVAGATGTAHSSISRRYDGNYSAQRQEMVESQIAYTVIRRYFVARWLREVYRRAVDLAIVSGLVDLRGADPASWYSFEPIEPATPWIDPQKEAAADDQAIRSRVVSRHQVIRKRGGDPAEVDAQIAADAMRIDVAPAPAAAPAPLALNGTEGE